MLVQRTGEHRDDLASASSPHAVVFELWLVPPYHNGKFFEFKGHVLTEFVLTLNLEIVVE